ncbi:hypothetical protein HPB51_023528 [Rhipicephalus microplus]|uniref:Monocarboxylate transporter n=1 Tax=Rhipicephalus microplus TaxID=6941 RepID=A0A9J6FA12_RHIMP|nr:hypothetical protein HPB51_023528 [Rhipicephalus microplus]
MAGTQLLWHLANAYGIEGCLLITGGLLLHVVPFTMLIKYPRPTRLSWCASAKHREKNTYNPVAQSLSSKANQVTSTCSHVLPDTLSPTHHPSPPTSSFASVIASMRTWSFYVALFYSAMCEYLFVTFNATVVAYGVDKGCSLVDSKQLVTYNSMGLLVGRVVIPFTTEKLRYRHCPGVVASFLAAAICFVVLTQECQEDREGVVETLPGFRADRLCTRALRALATFGVIVALADWARPTSSPVADDLRRQRSSDLLVLLYAIYRRRQHLSQVYPVLGLQ